MAATSTNQAQGSKHKRAPARKPARAHAGQRRPSSQPRTDLRPDQPASELQASLAQQMELQTANRELAARIAALESELSTARKQIELLRREGHAPVDRPSKALQQPTRRHRARLFGTAFFATLLGRRLRIAHSR
jgi:hypothetical protein